MLWRDVVEVPSNLGVEGSKGWVVKYNETESEMEPSLTPLYVRKWRCNALNAVLGTYSVSGKHFKAHRLLYEISSMLLFHARNSASLISCKASSQAESVCLHRNHVIPSSLISVQLQTGEPLLAVCLWICLLRYVTLSKRTWRSCMAVIVPTIFPRKWWFGWLAIVQAFPPSIGFQRFGWSQNASRSLLAAFWIKPE